MTDEEPVPDTYVPFQNPKINDDLMDAWLHAIMVTPGLTGPVLLDTLRALVAHLSNGQRSVTERKDGSVGVGEVS